MLRACIRSPARMLKYAFTRNTNGLISSSLLKYKNYSSATSNDEVTVNFILQDESKVTVKAKVGQHILQVAHDNDIDLEGACEASLACSTCHVYVEGDYFNKLPEACEEEEDLLDLAFGLQPNSRLGCQIILTKELDNITVRLPKATRNLYVDGKKPIRH